MPRITVTVESTTGSAIGSRGTARAVPEPPGRLGGWPVGKGTVPDTLGADGRPVEALVLMQEPALPGDEVAARPVALLQLSEADRDRDELVCVAEAEPFADLVDVPDLGRRHAGPSAWAGVLARLSHGSAPRVTGYGQRAEADRLVEQARHSYLQLTGCLE